MSRKTRVEIRNRFTLDLIHTKTYTGTPPSVKNGSKITVGNSTYTAAYVEYIPGVIVAYVKEGAQDNGRPTGA